MEPGSPKVPGGQNQEPTPERNGFAKQGKRRTSTLASFLPAEFRDNVYGHVNGSPIDESRTVSPGNSSANSPTQFGWIPSVIQSGDAGASPQVGHSESVVLPGDGINSIGYISVASLSVSSPSAPMPRLHLHLLNAFVYDFKQTLFAVCLSLLCCVPLVFVGFVMESIVQPSNLLPGMLLYRFFYQSWETNCKSLAKAYRFSFSYYLVLPFELSALASFVMLIPSLVSRHHYAFMVLFVVTTLGNSFRKIFDESCKIHEQELFHGFFFPFLQSCISIFPLLCMYFYCEALKAFENSQIMQAVIVGAVYPMFVVAFKQFVLGKYGSPFFFGRGAHLNEDWHLDLEKRYIYASIVRSIHGMYFPQTVGLFILYGKSDLSFVLACALRIGTQAVIKVVAHRGDEQLAIRQAKMDGVYDKKPEATAGLDEPIALAEAKKKIFSRQVPSASSKDHSNKTNTTSSHSSTNSKSPCFLKKGSTVSEEVARSMSVFGSDISLGKNMSTVDSTSGTEGEISSPKLSSEKMRRMGSMAGINATLQVKPLSKAKLDKPTNLCLAKLLGMLREYETKKQEKGVWTSSGYRQGCRTWFKSERLAAHQIFTPANGSSLSSPKGKLLTLRASAEIKDFGPSAIFDFLTMKNEIRGKSPRGATKTFQSNSLGSKNSGILSGGGTNTATTIGDQMAAGGVGKFKKDLRWTNVVWMNSTNDVSIHQVVNLPIPHRDREFIVRQIGIVFPDNTHIILRVNAKNPTELCSPSKKNILGVLKVGGFILQPIEGGSSTKITHIQQVDLKGNLTDSNLRNIAPALCGNMIDQCVQKFNHERLWPSSRDRLKPEDASLIKEKYTELKSARQEIAYQGSGVLGRLSGKQSWTCLKVADNAKLAYKSNEVRVSGTKKRTDRGKGVSSIDGGSNGTLITAYVEFSVTGSALEVAHSYAFQHSVDPPNFVEAIDGNSQVFQYLFKGMPKPFKPREYIFKSIRHVDEKTGSYIIVVNDVDHASFPLKNHFGKVRAYGSGVFLVEQKDANRCKVKRWMNINLCARIPKFILERNLVKSLESFTVNMQLHFQSKRERARVEEIMKARNDMLEVSWRDTYDAYTDHEISLANKASAWAEECAKDCEKEWKLLEENLDEDIKMWQSSVEIGKSLSKLARSSASKDHLGNPEDRDLEAGESYNSRMNFDNSANDDSSNNSPYSSNTEKGSKTGRFKTALKTMLKHSKRSITLDGNDGALKASSRKKNKVVAVLPGEEEAGVTSKVSFGTSRVEHVHSGASGVARLIFPSMSAVKRLKSKSGRSSHSGRKETHGTGKKGFLNNLAAEVRRNLLGSKQQGSAKSPERSEHSVKEIKGQDVLSTHVLTFRVAMDEHGNRGAVPVAHGEIVDMIPSVLKKKTKFDDDDEFDNEKGTDEAPAKGAEKEDDFEVGFEKLNKTDKKNAWDFIEEAMQLTSGRKKELKAEGKKKLKHLKERERTVKEQSYRFTYKSYRENAAKGSWGGSEGSNSRHHLSSKGGMGTASHTELKPHHTLHFGRADTVIDMPATMVAAWITDDHYKRGFRGEAEEGSHTTRREIEKFNDHSYIDYRRVHGFWPVLDRETTLYHISLDLDDGVFVHAAFSCQHDSVVCIKGEAVEVIFSSVHKVTPLEDGRSKVSYTMSFCDTGGIPSWILQQRLHSVLDVVGRCKRQLDQKCLSAKMLTWQERMHQLRKRMGVKWNEEAIAEKTLIVVSFPASLYLFGSETPLIALMLLMITESISDIITIIICKRFMDIDIGGKDLDWEAAGFRNWNSLLNCVHSTCSPVVACLVTFIIVGYFPS